MKRVFLVLIGLMVMTSMVSAQQDDRTKQASTALSLALTELRIVYTVSSSGRFAIKYNTSKDGLETSQAVYITPADWFSRSGFLYVHLISPFYGYKDGGDSETNVSVLSQSMMFIKEKSLPFNVRYSEGSTERYFNLSTSIEVSKIDKDLLQQYLEMITLWAEMLDLDIDSNDDW